MYDTPQEAGRGHHKLLLSILVSENFFLSIILKLVNVDYRWCQNGWIDSPTLLSSQVNLRLIIMWSVPFNFNLRDSYYAIGLTHNKVSVG